MMTWFALGIGAGLAAWFSQRREVIRLSPQAPEAAKRRVLAGVILRLLLSAALLTGALLEGIGAGLAAFVGLLLARWIGIASLKLLPIRVET